MGPFRGRFALLLLALAAGAGMGLGHSVAPQEGWWSMTPLLAALLGLLPLQVAALLWVLPRRR